MRKDLIPIPEAADRFLMELERFKGPVSIPELQQRLNRPGEKAGVLDEWIAALEGWVKASGLSGKDAQFIHNGFDRKGNRAQVIILSPALVRRAIETVNGL